VVLRWEKMTGRFRDVELFKKSMGMIQIVDQIKYADKGDGQIEEERKLKERLNVHFWILVKRLNIHF
jgi:hypothetical protein